MPFWALQDKHPMARPMGDQVRAERGEIAKSMSATLKLFFLAVPVTPLPKRKRLVRKMTGAKAISPGNHGIPENCKDFNLSAFLSLIRLKLSHNIYK
eukprot:1393475-Amorphochlora_amoeboformis.AAC.2